MMDFMITVLEFATNNSAAGQTINDNLNIISIVISIAALLLATIIAVVEIVKGEKDKQVALEAEYFRTIYGTHLLKKIPEARQKIMFDLSGSLLGSDTLLDELVQLRIDSAYFQYQDPNFYANLKKNIQNLEDDVTNSLNSKHFCEDQTRLLMSINTRLRDIYKIISNRYYGSRRF